MQYMCPMCTHPITTTCRTDICNVRENYICMVGSDTTHKVIRHQQNFRTHSNKMANQIHIDMTKGLTNIETFFLLCTHTHTHLGLAASFPPWRRVPNCPRGCRRFRLLLPVKLCARLMMVPIRLTCKGLNSRLL